MKTPNDLLHLVLKRHWYDETVSGRKRIEYREQTTKDEDTGEVKPSRWVRDIWGKREHIKRVRFARAYTTTTATFAVTHIDLGPCPIPGWGGEYIRIHFTDFPSDQPQIMNTETNNTTEGQPTPPTPYGYALWKHLHDEHGLTLTESELGEIINAAKPFAADALQADNAAHSGDLPILDDIGAVRGGSGAPHTFHDRPKPGDLPPHPDTARLDWLDTAGQVKGGGWNVDVNGYGYIHVINCVRDVGVSIRAAIDAARSQEGKEGA